jgi:hypothetical protein
LLARDLRKKTNPGSANWLQLRRRPISFAWQFGLANAMSRLKRRLTLSFRFTEQVQKVQKHAHEKN